MSKGKYLLKLKLNFLLVNMKTTVKLQQNVENLENIKVL